MAMTFRFNEILEYLSLTITFESNENGLDMFSLRLSPHP